VPATASALTPPEVDEAQPSSRRSFGSVRVRITLAAAGLVAVGLAAASFGLVSAVRANLEDEIERSNREQLDAVARQLERGVDLRDVRVPGSGPGGPPSLRAVGPGGQPIDVPGGLPGPPPGDPVRAQRRIETAAGQLTLISQRSLAEVDRTVDSITDALWLGVPALVALMAVLAWYVAGRALRPVEAIRAEAAAITGSTIHRRVPEPATDDEVGRLARTMNEMLDRLEESSVRQRQFVSDASHELRSPVAAIRAQLEVALRHPDRSDWPEVAHRVLEEDDRLASSVTELLELARLEEGAEAEPVDVDLDEMVLEEAARVRGRVEIDTAHVSAGRVRGSQAQLASVVRNVLDNAGRHATARVAVKLSADDGAVELVVDDDGPGIPEPDRARVFDRFTRLDEGRARDAGGVGLGLAMVRAIVERHGGTVGIADAPLGGARIEVRLPAA
jgi:signal transduction histidine kinase